MSVSNAHVLYNSHRPAAQQQTLLQFTKAALLQWIRADDLIDKAPEISETTNNTKLQRMTLKRWSAMCEMRNNGLHLPWIRGSELTTNSSGAAQSDHRGRCVLCNQKTVWACRKCGAWLCVNSKFGKDCMFDFHTQEVLHWSVIPHLHWSLSGTYLSFRHVGISS